MYTTTETWIHGTVYTRYKVYISLYFYIYTATEPWKRGTMYTQFMDPWNCVYMVNVA